MQTHMQTTHTHTHAHAHIHTHTHTHTHIHVQTHTHTHTQVAIEKVTLWMTPPKTPGLQRNNVWVWLLCGSTVGGWTDEG